MRIGRFLSVTAVLCLTGRAGFATTIVQTQGVGLTNVGNSFAVPVTFNQFDPALGTLTTVTLGLDASFSGTVGVENLSNVPDVASGVIAGSVTVATNGNSLVAEVFPTAAGPTHDLSAFDGRLDFAGTSGATDSVTGTPLATTVSAPPPGSALYLFTGNDQVFLTLIATSFPIVEGREQETVEETANANATVQLTYTYAPVPEPGTAALLSAGAFALLWPRRKRHRKNAVTAPRNSCEALPTNDLTRLQPSRPAQPSLEFNQDRDSFHLLLI